MIKNRNGNILPILLIIMTVLGILGIAITNVSYSANREAIFSEDRAQAYYIAKSGADIVIKNIEEIKKEVEEEKNKTKEYTIVFDEGDTIINIFKEDDKIKIVSKATVKKSTQTIKAELSFKNNGSGKTILAVGDSGIYASSDGSNWIQKSDVGYMNSVAWDGNNIVVVGNNGTILNLTLDGGNLNSVRKPISDMSHINDIIWDGSRFYVINHNGRVYQSVGGLEWKEKKKNNGFQAGSLAYGNGILVMASNNKGNISYSSNYGDSWDLKSIASNQTEFYNITYGNSIDRKSVV